MSLQDISDQLDKLQLRLEDIIHLNKAELGRAGLVWKSVYCTVSRIILRCQRNTLDPN